MPKIPNIKKTQIIITTTLTIPHMECAKDEIITFISGFLDIILKGLKVLNNLKMPRLTLVEAMSTIAVTTIIKSRTDQLSLRYAFSPRMKPFAIIFNTHYKMNIPLNTLSKTFEILANSLPYFT